MNNIGSMYEMTVSSTQSRDTTITYDALEALLLSVEHPLSTQNSLNLDFGTTSLLPAHPRGAFNQGSGFSLGGLFHGEGGCWARWFFHWL